MLILGQDIIDFLLISLFSPECCKACFRMRFKAAAALGWPQAQHYPKPGQMTETVSPVPVCTVHCLAGNLRWPGAPGNLRSTLPCSLMPHSLSRWGWGQICSKCSLVHSEEPKFWADYGENDPHQMFRKNTGYCQKGSQCQGKVQYVCVLETLLGMSMKETTWVEKNQFKYKDGKYKESFTYESKVFVATQMVITPKVWSYCENSKHISMQQGLSLWVLW